MIIYKIQNKINNKIYIGQTVYDLNKRIADHLLMKSPIGNALRKYGIQCFDISVIDTAETKEWLNDKEMEYIALYDCKSPNGYNLTDGGNGNSGWNMPDQTKKKISEKAKGHRRRLGIKHTPESKQKMVDAWIKNKSTRKILKGDDNPAKRPEVREKIRKSILGLNYHHTNESIEKIKMSHLGRKHTEETKEKLRKPKKNYPKIRKGQSKEVIEKRRLESIGRKHTEETKQKMRLSHLERKGE